jgi:hypothetical protein
LSKEGNGARTKGTIMKSLWTVYIMDEMERKTEEEIAVKSFLKHSKLHQLGVLIHA